MFTIKGEDMAELLRWLHIARVDINAYLQAEESGDFCEEHLADLASEAGGAAGVFCTTVERLLFDKENWSK